MKTVLGYKVEILKVKAEACDKATIRVYAYIDDFTAYEIACELLDSTDLQIFDIEYEGEETVFVAIGNFCTTYIL